MGLPEWDTVRMTLEGNEGLEGTGVGQQLLDEETAVGGLSMLRPQPGTNRGRPTGQEREDQGDRQATAPRSRRARQRARGKRGREEGYDGVLLQEAGGDEEDGGELGGRLLALQLGRPQAAAELHARRGRHQGPGAAVGG
jgi:hypothetical protein